jgi:hypothetical protein
MKRYRKKMPTDKPRRKISKETNPDHTSNLKTSEQ